MRLCVRQSSGASESHGRSGLGRLHLYVNEGRSVMRLNVEDNGSASGRHNDLGGVASGVNSRRNVSGVSRLEPLVDGIHIVVLIQSLGVILVVIIDLNRSVEILDRLV